MKMALQTVKKEIAELWSSPGDDPNYTQIFEVLERNEPLFKQHIIDFAYKCTLVRNIDLDGNIIFCFDPEELYNETFKTL